VFYDDASAARVLIADAPAADELGGAVSAL
jgi:hypothetical protein